MAGRQRLDQIDAVRPLKQAGVVSAHTIITFAPVGARALQRHAALLRVSREAFFSISACMLTYAYSGLKRDGWRSSTGAGSSRSESPTCAGTPSTSSGSSTRCTTGYTDNAWSALAHFGRQLEIGYDQLYFLIVIAEFYVAFPVVLWVLRRTRGTTPC